MRLFSGLGSQPDGTHGRRAGAAARWGRHLAAGWGLGGTAPGSFSLFSSRGKGASAAYFGLLEGEIFGCRYFPQLSLQSSGRGDSKKETRKATLNTSFRGGFSHFFPPSLPLLPPPPLCGTWVLRAPSSGSAAWARGAKGLAPPVPLFAPLFSGGSGGRSHAPPGCPSREGCDPPCPSPEGDRSSCAPKTCPVPAGLTRVLGLWPGAGCRMLGASYEAPPAPSRAPLGHPWVKDRR